MAFLLRNFSSSITSYLTDNAIYQNQDARVILFALGAGLVFFKILSWVKTLLSLLQRPKDLSARYGKGTWAVISGGSEGIGKAFGFELASKGFNIVLISRRKDKLEEAAKEIKQKYPSTQTRVVVADFAKAHEEGFAEKILEQVRDLDVSILVNNAGIATEAFYADIPVNKIRDLVTINCLSHALLTRVFLPKLTARSQKSAIINVASLGAVAAVPVYQVYTASKAFLDYLSRGLAYEHPNMDILSFKPGMVSTAMNKNKKVDHETITAEECVKSALKELGHSSETIGHFKHKRQLAILMSLPDFMLEGYIKNVILPNGRKAAKEAKELHKD